MSAIWGVIDFHGNPISKKVKDIMSSAYTKCAIDRYQYYDKDNIYMGCGLQFVTTESIYEQVPFNSNKVFFNTDAMLDNRGDIFHELQIEESNNISDGELIFRMYQKQGEKCLNTLLGAYVFCWYDDQHKRVDIVSDAVGFRSVYYMIQNGILYYSSLMTPLVSLKSKIDLNERWLADYIGQDNLNIFTESEEVPIKGIFRVEPGGMVRIVENNVSKKKYWNPIGNKRKKIRFKNDEEYKKNFVKLYHQCVKCVLRSPMETGIYLSGGLDSTSVACLVAPELANNHKKLFSFTSVPDRMFKLKEEKDEMTDETEVVLRTKEKYSNIECTFMDMPGMNCWDGRKEYQKICELPYKSPQNMLWLYEGMKIAKDKNCKVILSGAFGNGTVSFSALSLYFLWLLQRGHWITFYKEICATNAKMHYTKKSMILGTLKLALGRGNWDEKKQDVYGNTYAKHEYLEKNKTKERLIKLEKRVKKSLCSYKKYHDSFIPPETIRHYGEFAQVHSIYTGVMFRDPTRDKRMIEFTYGIPYSQFNCNGIARRLIREYMADLMPDYILQHKKIGIQSADMQMRLLKEQDRIINEWLNFYEEHVGDMRIDTSKAISELYGKSISSMSNQEIMRHIYTIIFMEYTDKLNKKE